MARNIVLIILDAVRKDYFDEHAPRLKQLADVSFDQCRSGSSCSVPSHSAMLTGMLPHESGVMYTQVRYDHIDRSETFLDGLPDHRTLGVSANPWASTEFGFGSYFDDFVNISRHRRFQDGMDITHFVYDESEETGKRLYAEFLLEALRRDNTLQSLANGAFAQINRTASKLPFPKPFDDGATTMCREVKKRCTDDEGPFFCFTNFMDAHSPMQHVLGYDRSVHDVPSSWSSLSFDRQPEATVNHGGVTEESEEFVSNYRQLYGASIDYLDRKVSRLITEIQEQTDGETTFVVTSDHGENLGYEAEDHYFGHNGSLSEGLLHVPLYIVNPPDGMFAEREDRYFTQLDLGKLLVSLANEEPADVFRDSVPAELIGGDMEKLQPFATEDEIRHYSRAQRCVISDDSKLLWDSLGGTVEYRLDRSRPNWQEEVGRGVEVPDWATNQFAMDLIEFCEQIDKSGSYADQEDIGDSTKERLKDLGYI